MIAAISLMRRRDDITLTAFRRHWLDVHGPLVCAFPALRHYTQSHVITSLGMNDRARQMRVDGFPILWFDNDADRQRAHRSPQMAACNVDSQAFIGAVSRIICECHEVMPQRANAGRVSLIALLPGEQANNAALDQFAGQAGKLPRLAGLTLFRVLQQGAAPNSTITHLQVNVAGVAALTFASLVDLEESLAEANTDAALFVVEEHRLV